jgi:2-dehydropantoate 2-reductase
VKIAIVGVGAMGSLFAYLLYQAGHSPWLLDRYQTRVDTIKKDGLRVEGVTGTHHIDISKITLKPGEIGIVDLLIIFVKTYDTGEAIRGAVSLIGDKTLVLTLQNGLNNLERITEITGKSRAIGGTTAHGATQLSRGHIRHAGIGETVIGSLKGEEIKEISKIKDLLNSSGIKTTITDDVEGTIWSKLVINAGINPLTALTRLKNGEIIEHSELLDVQLRIVEEAYAVAKAKGITIHYSDPVEKVKDVCRATASNKSSMLQDIENGKRTEIDYINGAIVSEGSKYHIPTPYNRILTVLVKALEIQRVKYDIELGQNFFPQDPVWVRE